jgi:hypothetical protein
MGLSGIAVAVAALIAVPADAGIKPGDWETQMQRSSNTISMEGGLPPEAAARLKDLPPEMQAKVRAAMAKAQAAQPALQYFCVTPEQAASDGFNSQSPESGCKITTVSHSAIRTEQTLDCRGNDMSSTGRMVTEIVSPVLMRGSIEMKSAQGNMSQQWTSRWVSPSCHVHDKR